MANKHVSLLKSLTVFEFNELKVCMENVYEFAKHIFLIHPKRGKVKFELYDFQKRVLWYFLTERFNIILKFRQAGMTELISMYALWMAMYQPNKNIMIISIKERVAKKVLRKIKYMYKNLPEHLKVPVVNGRTGDIGTASEMEFSNGSMISSLPTTEDAGRSEGLSLLVVDEAAIIKWANQIWASAWPTLSTGGSAIVNSCVTGDTMIVGENGNFRIDTVCPKQFGKQDISSLGLKVLSHKGKWQRVLGSVNKGELETWEVVNEFGDILKCTPKHKLYTPKGWRTVQEIIEGDLNTIVYNPGTDELKEPPITIPPLKEILKPIPGFPNYKVSNMGKVYIDKDGILKQKEGSINRRGYYSIKLWNKGIKKKRGISNLVAEAFIGNIPPGYITDHINCNPLDNYSTNLQIITISENGKRAALYSRGMKLGGRIGKGFPNLKLIAKIREKHLMGKSPDEIIDECFREANLVTSRAFISRIINKRRTNTVQISKLKLVRKYMDTIYDISVEEDKSYITDSHYVNHNTPYGVGNWFHKLWVDACAKGNKFKAIRLKWQMHPERDQDWYDEQRQILGPRRTAQEIDGDFLTSGNSVFDLMDIRALEEAMADYEILRIEENGSLLVYAEPKKDTQYFIGGDVSTGRARDYSTFSIMDRHGVDHAVYKGKIPVDRYADLLMKYGKKYGFATLAPEGNDIGLAVVMKIQESGYRNLYYSSQLVKEKGEKKPKEVKIPGWLTTKKNRPIIIDNLEEDIRLGNIEIKDPFFVQEAYTFIYDDRNKPIAMGKDKKLDDGEEEGEIYTDDSILGKAITNHIRKGKIKSMVSLPK